MTKGLRQYIKHLKLLINIGYSDYWELNLLSRIVLIKFHTEAFPKSAEESERLKAIELHFNSMAKKTVDNVISIQAGVRRHA